MLLGAALGGAALARRVTLDHAVPAGSSRSDSSLHFTLGSSRPVRDPASDTTPPIVPDSSLTPGATLAVTTADICTPGYARKVRDVPASVKREAYAEYHVTHHAPGEYEVDHLISLELGGSNSIRNLWPESYRTSPWNAHVKDALENLLHRRVCDGSLDLATAQRDIAKNWIAAYRHYFHRRLPPAPRVRPAS